MIIGLYDMDMIKYTHVPFNLELMKLSSYYKKRGEIVGLSASFSPNMYNKFICRKDFYDGDFSYVINDKILYGGRAFNRDKYIPLDLEIERQKPDIFIYERLKNQFCINKRMTQAFEIMSRAEHFRLSLDGKTIWNDFEKQINISSLTHTLFLHDYNLNNIQNSDIIIKEIMKEMSKNHRHLAVKFPIEVNNSEDLFKWTEFSPSSNFFLLQYNGLMDDEVLYNFVKKQKGTSIARQLDYIVTDNCKDEKDFIKKLQILFKQITFLRMERQKVNLKYKENFFFDKRWERLIELFQNYLNNALSFSLKKFNQKIKYDSLYSYVWFLKEEDKFKNNTITKQEARELFQLVRENNYECFKDFYECHTVELKGGIFQNE